MGSRRRITRLSRWKIMKHVILLKKRSKSFCSNRDSSILTIWKERFWWISTFSNWIWECCKKYEWFFWSHVHSPTWNKIHRNGDEFGSMLRCYEQFKLDFLKFVTFWSVKFLFVTFYILKFQFLNTVFLNYFSWIQVDLFLPYMKFHSILLLKPDLH